MLGVFLKFYYHPHLNVQENSTNRVVWALPDILVNFLILQS